MESFADKTLFFLGEPMDDSAPDPREARYQLAERLVDNIRFGEAIRILESLGDYGNSPALLKQVRALKAYSDIEEDRLKDERRQRIRERAEREERARRRRRVFYILSVAVLALLLVLNR